MKHIPAWPQVGAYGETHGTAAMKAEAGEWIPAVGARVTDCKVMVLTVFEERAHARIIRKDYFAFIK